MKSLPFLFAAIIILSLTTSVAATSQYVSVYPPAFNGTYVNATTWLNISPNLWLPAYAMNTSMSLTAGGTNVSWVSSQYNNTTQKFLVDLGSAKQIDRLYLENFHATGLYTSRGLKTFNFYGSNSSYAFANRTYSNVTGWVNIAPDTFTWNQHSAADASDPQYILLTNHNTTYRYYMMAVVDNYGDTEYVGFRRLELQRKVVWEYTTPGTYTWQCPANVTNITIQLIGGGSSGTPSAYGSYSPKGGAAGEYKAVPIISVTPGTNYTIVVPSGGARAAASTVRNNGDTAVAFGYTAVGGISASTSNDGDIGYLNSTKFSEDGQCNTYTCSAYPNGDGGTGYGAGGGGGGTSTPVILYGYGGKGADGYILISDYSEYTGNIPAFSADATTAPQGTLIKFTDDSRIFNTTGLTYEWDFGDGTTSTVNGDVSHVYAYLGSYTVKLTLLQSGTTSVTETKDSYINIVSTPTVYANPRTVLFQFTDYFNNPISGMQVNATPLNATIPSNWFVEYYGFGSGVTLTATGFGGVTGNDGSWAAPMSESINYRLNFSTSSYTLYPTKNSYQLRIPLNVSAITTPSSNYISYTMANSTINSTAEFFNFTYQDTTGGTSSLLLTVRNSSGSLLYNNTTTGFGTSAVSRSSGALVHSAGETYTYRISAQQAQVGYVNKTATVTWENLRTLEGYPSWVGQWLGVLVLVVLAGSVGFASTKYMLIILPIVTFFMMVYTRWLTPVIGVTAMVASLGILLVLGILRYIRDAKNRMVR